MAKKPQVSQQLTRELSRKHVSRAQRDARNSRLLLLGVGGALALSVLLILFGALRESVFLPNEPVAMVGEQSILSREFQQRVRLERYQLIQQYDFYQSLGLTDNANQALQQLSDSLGIGSQVLNTLIDEALYRQAAPELGVTVSPEEVQTTIEEGFNYYRVPPTPAPTFTPRPTSTVSPESSVTPAPTITPQPTATPVTAEGFQTLFQQRLNDLAVVGFGEADYRRLVETQLIAQDVQDIVLKDIITITEQSTFEFIVANSDSDAEAILSAVDSDGFDTVYGQVLSQTFPITTVFASEYPYTPRQDLADASEFGPNVADAVFSTPISGTFGVVSNTLGSNYFVGRVLNREVRELSSDALSRRQSDALQNWLAQRRELVGVQVLTWEDRVPDDPAVGLTSGVPSQ